MCPSRTATSESLLGHQHQGGCQPRGRPSPLRGPWCCQEQQKNRETYVLPHGPEVLANGRGTNWPVPHYVLNLQSLGIVCSLLNVRPLVFSVFPPTFHPPFLCSWGMQRFYRIWLFSELACAASLVSPNRHSSSSVSSKSLKKITAH